MAVFFLFLKRFFQLSERFRTDYVFNITIVILDEATAYIDPENEAIIQQAVARLVEGKTVLVLSLIHISSPPFLVFCEMSLSFVFSLCPRI